MSDAFPVLLSGTLSSIESTQVVVSDSLVLGCKMAPGEIAFTLIRGASS